MDVDGDTMVVGLPTAIQMMVKLKHLIFAPSTPVELTTQNAKEPKPQAHYLDTLSELVAML